MSYLHPCFKPIEVQPIILPRLGHTVICSAGILRVILHQIDQKTGNDLLVYECLSQSSYFFSPQVSRFVDAYNFLKEIGLFQLRQLVVQDSTFLQQVVPASILGRRQIGDTERFEDYLIPTYLSMIGGLVCDPISMPRAIPGNVVELVLPPEEAT